MRRLTAVGLILSAACLVAADPIGDRIDFWKKRPKLVPKAVAEAGPAPRVVRPRFEALAVGVDRLSAERYGLDLSLSGAESDARALAKAVESRGGTAKTLLGKDATLAAVSGALRDAVGRLQNRDVFWLHFAGFVGRVPDANGDEGGRPDEVFALVDGVLLDDELMALLSAAPAGSRLIVTIDGGAAGDRASDLKAVAGFMDDGEVLRRRVARVAAEKSGGGEQLARRLPAEAVAAIVAKQGRLLNQAQESIGSDTARGGKLLAPLTIVRVGEGSAVEFGDSGSLVMGLVPLLGKASATETLAELVGRANADLKARGVGVPISLDVRGPAGKGEATVPRVFAE